MRYWKAMKIDVNIEESEMDVDEKICFTDVVPGFFIAKKELVLTDAFSSTNIGWFQDFTLNASFGFQ